MFSPRTAVLCTLLLAPALPCLADPGYYVVTAYDNAGLRTVDLRYWTVENKRRPKADWPELGVSWGVNSRWTTGLLYSWIGGTGEATELSTVNWANDVLLTQGEWPLDIALHTQWIKERYEPGSGAFEWGPALQTDLGRTQLNLNVFFERPTGHERDTPTQLKYQWQLRHRWLPGLHLGLQGFGELGDWNRPSPHSQQSHRAGPALFGTVRFGEPRTLKLTAAWLQGRTYGRSGHMLSLRGAFEF